MRVCNASRWMNSVSMMVFIMICGTSLTMAEQQLVKPEVTTPVVLSNTDVNRIVCTDGEINDVFSSQEKGIVIQPKGKNAFVKYLINVDGARKTLVNEITEIHIVCNEAVYTLIAQPKRVQSRTVRLMPGIDTRIKDNIERYGAMPFEQKVIKLTQAAYKDDIPDTFKITTMHERMNVLPKSKKAQQTFTAVSVTKIREIRVEGLGLKLSEYTLDAKKPVQLHETDFLMGGFGADIAGVTAHPLRLNAFEQGRLFVVSKSMN